MKDFDYAAPSTLLEAARLLNGANGKGRILAGGTDLLVQLREGIRQADLVVDVKRIPEMTEISPLEGGGWRIGAAVPCQKIEAHAGITQAYPAVADAVRIIGGWQIKNRATLGGNLCTASPAGDSIPALIASGARALVIDSEGRRREIPLPDFCAAPGRNRLEPGELVEAFLFPPPAADASGCYLRFIPRYEMDIAVVGVGSTLSIQKGRVREARIGLGAVAPTPLLANEASAWLVGQPATLESFDEAGRIAQNIARPISDMRGPADYRTHLVRVLVKRTLALAARRLAGETIDPLHVSFSTN
jgi:carbon-monoxide dehydrogenase medium subunit